MVQKWAGSFKSNVYALQCALAYTFAMFAGDFLAARLAPAWGGYGQRTVGRLLAIWSPGFGLVFVAIGVAIKRQRTLEVQTAQALKVSLMPVPQPAQNPGSPSWVLAVMSHDGELRIPLVSISHITVEDHYSRIFFGNGDGRHNVLIRQPLKNLLAKLPGRVFWQIHRSHVVNLKHLAGLNKKGRQSMVMLGPQGIELPVSRHRRAHLKPAIWGGLTYETKYRRGLLGFQTATAHSF